jgi:hypothetical protein
MRIVHSEDFEGKSFIGLLGYSYKRYINVFSIIAPALIVLLAIQYFILQQFLTNFNSDPYFNSLFPIVQLFFDILTSVIFFAFLALTFLTNDKNYFKVQFSIFKRIFPLIGTLLGISILYFLSIAGGSVFLLIPGFLFLAWFSFVPFNIVYEKTGILDSFKRSKQLTKGLFWKIFIVLAVFHLIREVLHSGLLTLHPNELMSYITASILTIPAESIAMLILYFNQKAEQEAVHFNQFIKEVS